MSLQVEIVDMLHVQDNYNFLLHDDEANVTAVVDPSEADGILEALAEKGWSLDYILNTHHHWDHVTGNPKLKRETGCKVVGYGPGAERIPGIDIKLNEDDVFELGNHKAEVIFIPGHTSDHIAYYFEKDGLLFCGDTMFTMGCGRLFEGTPKQMHDSLHKLAALPDKTIVYNAHEYALGNGAFAQAMEPHNPYLKKRMIEMKARRAERIPTVPTSIGEEKLTNPFLRTASDEIRATLNMQDAADTDVFAELRRRKDSF